MIMIIMDTAGIKSINNFHEIETVSLYKCILLISAKNILYFRLSKKKYKYYWGDGALYTFFILSGGFGANSME